MKLVEILVPVSFNSCLTTYGIAAGDHETAGGSAARMDLPELQL